MTGDQIPDNHHVARYCKGTVVGTGAAFLLKAGENYLSVNWLEYLKLDTREAQVAEIRNVLRKKLSLGSTAKIAVLNVETTKQHVMAQTADRRILSFLHEPLAEDESHSGIHNTRSQDELMVAELIAETILEDYPVK